MTEEIPKNHKHSRSNFGIIAQIQESGLVSAVVLTVEEKFKSDTVHKSWIFPGGSLNPGETDKVNLIRELGEEISMEQKVLEIDHETVHFVLEIKKPGDFGGRLTQNFWYIPMSPAITLRGEDESVLMESDGALLGQPAIVDIGEVIKFRNLKLTHFAASIIFLSRLINPDSAMHCYGIEKAVSEAIRARYRSLIAPYQRKTYYFLEILRGCRQQQQYNQALYTYNRTLHGIRGSKR